MGVLLTNCKRHILLMIRSRINDTPLTITHLLNKIIIADHIRISRLR